MAGTVLIPAITLGVFVLTAVAIWLVAGVTVMVLGDSGAIANGPAAILRTSALFLYTLVVQSLWFAPFFAWVLLASAWARRAPLLWVFLPPVALVVAEQILLDSNRFLTMLSEQSWKGYALAFGGEHSMIGWEDGPHRLHGVPNFAEFLTPGQLLASGELWIGIAVAIAFLAAATWLRRYRDEA
jgi:ABC-2 type transport system permease protein